jgi:adenylate cyclase
VFLLEIERKFLTRNVPCPLSTLTCSSITQYYISVYPTIRIRQKDQAYWLTVKGSGTLSREEFNLPLTQEEFHILQKKAETLPIIKDRYTIPLGQALVAELDIYHGALEGLITTEVEFASEKDALQFQPPSWFGTEVTYDTRYTNASLALYGIPKEKQ